MDNEKIRKLPRRRTLDVFFNPKNVAVIGATDAARSVGRSLLANLRDAPFPGAIYPVNPRHDALLGLRCYRNIASIPEPVDLAVIATPANSVPGVIRECVDSGVPAATIISAGFREIGERGAALGIMDSNRPRVRQWSPAAQCNIARHDSATSLG